jgi:hypothetical protein
VLFVFSDVPPSFVCPLDKQTSCQGFNLFKKTL